MLLMKSFQVMPDCARMSTMADTVESAKNRHANADSVMIMLYAARRMKLIRNWESIGLSFPVGPA